VQYDELEQLREEVLMAAAPVVTQTERLAAGFSPRRAGFNSMIIHVRFLIDELNRSFHEYTCFPMSIIISPGSLSYPKAKIK
jgi:hypothetical protein